ncbi:protein TonB (plasmid) [Fulvitalea axinellae]|uniref:Protein TonB n=1 Tax=Fulvitalea axinellae TaxID=1182444 RepID=A0AAU9CX06_9BACT|nr:protein TonB [Fulvitalea axinellae]
MEAKKNPKYDIHEKRPVFLGLGLCLSITMCITAFNWKDYGDREIVDPVFQPSIPEQIEIIDNTFQEKKPPAPIKFPKIEVVPDEQEIIEVPIEIDPTIEDPEESIEEPDWIEEPVEPSENLVHIVVESYPEFPGGINKFYKYVSNKLKYPSQARRQHVEGKVYIQFIVERDGSLTDIKVAKGIGGGCDDEAIRVLKSSPRWQPGKQRGRPVRVRMIIPIVFKLN